MNCFTVAGWAGCPSHQRAIEASKQMADSGQARSSEEKTFGTREEYRAWLLAEGRAIVKRDPRAESHTTSPFVWRHDGNGNTAFVGGCDDIVALSTGGAHSAAEAENRLISAGEGAVRKTAGLAIFAVVAVALVLFPSIRESYGPVSLGLSVGGGVYMTGRQSL